MKNSPHIGAPKKSLGQNFLHNPIVAKKMTAAAAIGKDDTVLEVGPGKGFLTKEFLENGAHVIALEADARLVRHLEDAFDLKIQSGQLRVVHGDVRTVRLGALGLKDHEYKLVANIPYYLSGFLFRFFLTNTAQPSCLVFLVQKEIAQRIARAKKESLLSLSVKAYGTPEYLGTIKAGNFTPAPKVSSAILRIHSISRNNFTNIDEGFFFEILHLGFASKRKQLLGNLSGKFDRALLVHIFSTLDLREDVRAEDVPLKIWLELVHTLSTHKK